MLKEGMSVGLCSDAGYPGISDAGYRIISSALDEGIAIEVIPGAGAIEPALLSSGLPDLQLHLQGLPATEAWVCRKRFLAMDKELPHTLVYYESPFRLHKLLVDALEVLGDRRAAVCVELTKQFEKTHRGTSASLSNSSRTRRSAARSRLSSRAIIPSSRPGKRSPRMKRTTGNLDPLCLARTWHSPWSQMNDFLATVSVTVHTDLN